MKYIFTLATNGYAEYFENFKKSINNFYPNEDKTLIVFSNKLEEHNEWQIGNTKINIINIPNLLYTSIVLNKFNFIEWYAIINKLDDNQLIFFFDIDTYFYNDCEHAQNELTNIINEHINSVIFTNELDNLYIKQNNINRYMHGYVYNDDDLNIKEPKIFSDYSFSDHNLWCRDCRTSFFCGTIKSIKKLNIIYTEYYKEILHTDRIIPYIYDEDMINYIWLKQLIGEINEQYIYVTDNSLININKKEIDNKNYYINTSDINDQIKLNEEYVQFLICNQKYDAIKHKIKSSII